MILAALNDYYERLQARASDSEEVARPGYSREKISYEIVLARDGQLVDVNDIRDTSGKKPIPRVLNVPQPEKRTVGIKPNFLWDKTSYVFGVSAVSKRAAQEHEAFWALHRDLLSQESDEGLKSLLTFLEKWKSDRFQAAPFCPEMIDANMVFRLDGERTYLHDRPAARALRARVLQSDTGGSAGTCLVTGAESTLARLHPAIKGVRGAQSSGASIVSFNLESFNSYGKTQGQNAPISEQAAFAYTTALNYLLRADPHNRQRLQIGDATVVFWALADETAQAAAAESLVADFLDPPSDDGQETERLRLVLDSVEKGRPMQDLDPRLDERTRIFVLGLAPNASRLSIRYWECETLGSFASPDISPIGDASGR